MGFFVYNDIGIFVGFGSFYGVFICIMLFEFFNIFIRLKKKRGRDFNFFFLGDGIEV